MSNYFRRLRSRKIEERLDRAMIPLSGNSSRWEVLKHPLFTITFGFILTGLLGSYLVNRYQEDAKEREWITQERKQNYELSLKSVEDFTNLVYTRRTTAAMLQSSLKRKVPKEELIQRKRDYDVAFSEWNSKLQTTLFSIRRITGSSTYSYFENLVETELRRPFVLLDACLTDAYDFSIKIKAKRQYRKCDIDNLLKVALGCSYAMSNELYKFVVVDRQKSALNRQSRIQAASLKTSRQCDVSNIAVETDAPQAVHR